MELRFWSTNVWVGGWVSVCACVVFFCLATPMLIYDTKYQLFKLGLQMVCAKHDNIAYMKGPDALWKVMTN